MIHFPKVPPGLSTLYNGVLGTMVNTVANISSAFISNLNPNAKSFTPLNPNAREFTPAQTEVKRVSSKKAEVTNYDNDVSASCDFARNISSTKNSQDIKGYDLSDEEVTANDDKRRRLEPVESVIFSTHNQSCDSTTR